jgi:hypothetical protein
MRDYRLCRMFFDLQSPEVVAELRSNREAMFSKYSLEEPVKDALRRDDVTFLAERTNAYLLRYYFFAAGMKDPEFIRRLRDG